MKISDLKKPTLEVPEGNRTPKEHRETKTILTDRISENLCAQRVSLESLVPLCADLKTVAATNNEVLFKVADLILEATDRADKNTDRIIEAMERLISKLDETSR